MLSQYRSVTDAGAIIIITMKNTNFISSFKSNTS